MKKLLLFLILFISLFFTTGCDSEKPNIAFSKTPFSQTTGYSLANTFKPGEKIYYAIYNPKGFKTKLLKLQVFKKNDNNSEFWGYEYLYNKTLELRNKNAFTDYVVINSAGHFIFQVFDYTNFQKPVAIGIVKIAE